jgi:DnaJ-class molecular chaperone
MATDEPTGDDQICTPCRGTGHLISGLGGTPHQVTCPWCGGTGRFTPGLDAQEHPAEGGSGNGSGPQDAPAQAGELPGGP